MSNGAPCPFCGFKNAFLIEDSQRESIYSVKCFSCGATGPSAFSDQAWQKWENRVIVAMGHFCFYTPWQSCLVGGYVSKDQIPIDLRDRDCVVLPVIPDLTKKDPPISFMPREIIWLH